MAESHQDDNTPPQDDETGETGPSLPPAAASEKKRRRPPLACEQCRRKKIKCDKKFPCGHCERARISNCSYAPTHIPASKAGKKTSLTSHTTLGSNARQTPILPAPSLGSNSPPREGRATSLESLGISKVSSSAQSSILDSEFDSQNVDFLIARVRELEEKLANGFHISDGQSKVPATQSKTHPVSAPKGTISKTRYFGNSHWVNIVELLPTELNLLGRANAEKTDLFQILSQCKAIGRKIKKNRQRPLSSETLGQSLPAKDVADQLVDKYLSTFEGVLRIVHVPTFRQDYERYWQNPGAANMSFVMQLQLCLALGAIAHDDVFSMRAMAMHWISEAQLWLTLPPEKAKMTIAGVQTWCLLVQAKSCCGVGQDLTWVTMGSLVRLAMYMGLHRDPRHLGQMTVYRAEVRRRLWATILELNLQCAFEAGASPLLSVTDYDTSPPSNLDDDQLVDENDGEEPVGQPLDTPTMTSVQLCVIKSLPLRLNLLRIINDFRSGRPYEEILRLNSELTKVCRELTHNISSLRVKQKELGHSKITSFHLSVAEVFLYRFFHALHQSAISKAFNDHRFYFSRRMCLDSALKLLHLWGITKPQAVQPAESMDEFRRLVDNGLGLFRYIAVQSLFFVAVELINQKSSRSVSLGYLPAVGDPDLRFCLETARSWTLDRVRAGETNVKAHCFVVACLGHIDALGAGLSNEQINDAILQATIGSARVCLEALREVAEREGVSSDDSLSGDIVDMDGITTVPLEWMGDWQWGDMDGVTFSQFAEETPFEGIDQTLLGNF